MDQEGFRWRNDNGSQTTATWKAVQDSNTSNSFASVVRLRVLLDTATDPPTSPYTLYYKKSTDSTWLPVPVGSGGGAPVYVAASANIAASGEDTTAQLTPPSGKTVSDFSTGRMWDDENGTDPLILAQLYPTATSVGIAAIPGWTPTTTYADETIFVTVAGTIIEDIRLTNGTIEVMAPNVTVRRCELINSGIFNEHSGILYNHLLIEDVTIRSSPPGKWFPNVYNVSVGFAGYTCRRVAIIDTNEGVHTGGSQQSLANPSHPQGHGVRLEDCFTRIRGPQSSITGMGCQADDDDFGYEEGEYIDYHGDCCQAQDDFEGGVPLTIRNCAWFTLDQNPPGSPGDLAGFPCGASSVMYNYGVPSMTDKPAWWDATKFGLQSMPPDVDRLLVSGAANTVHLDCGGTYRNLLIENGKWIYTPVEIEPTQGWPMINPANWECWMVDIDSGTGQPTVKTARIPHGWPGYGPMDPP